MDFKVFTKHYGARVRWLYFPIYRSDFIMFCLGLLSLFLPLLVTSVPHYYIVVRLSADHPQPISAQFKLEQPYNSSRAWDCVSGLTPIVFPSGGHGRVVKAQSIDVRVGSVVECLGLNVRVLQSVPVVRWQGEGSVCPGHITSTTQLERSDAATTEYFALNPVTTFHVFSTKPDMNCSVEEVQLIPSPSLIFHHQSNVPAMCSVLSPYLDILTCNLTVSVSNDDVIAVSIGAKSIKIPLYGWHIGIRNVNCTYQCRIHDSDVTRTGSIISRNTSAVPELAVYTAEDPSHPSSSGSRYPRRYIIIISVLAALLFISTLITIFLINLSRDLRRKLERLSGRRCRVTGARRLLPGPPEPDLTYSRIHQITNACHHYNTVSLRLSDSSKDMEKSQTFPVYQKLSLNESESAGTCRV